MTRRAVSRDLVAARASELECQATIIATAKLAGWRCHAQRAAFTGDGRVVTPIQGHRGFPDLVLAHPRRRLLIVAELKRHKNTVEPEQRIWHAALAAAGVPVSIWWVPEQQQAILAFLTDQGPRPTSFPTFPGAPPARAARARAEREATFPPVCSVCDLPEDDHTPAARSACESMTR